MSEYYTPPSPLEERKIRARIRRQLALKNLDDDRQIADEAFVSDRGAWDVANATAEANFRVAEARAKAYTIGEQNNPDALEHMADSATDIAQREQLNKEAEIARKLEGLRASFKGLATRLEKIIPQIKSPAGKEFLQFRVDWLKNDQTPLEQPRMDSPIDLYRDGGPIVGHIRETHISPEDLQDDRNLIMPLMDEWNTVFDTAAVTLDELRLTRFAVNEEGSTGRYIDLGGEE